MFGVKNALRCPPKTGTGAAYVNVFFLLLKKAHQRMRNE